MPTEPSVIHELGVRTRGALRVVAQVATKGLPAMRAAMHGARLGAGRALTPAIIERLGVRVIPETARAVADGLSRSVGEAAVVMRRGGSVLRAGARELVVHGDEGLTLRVSPRGGAAATVSHDAVRTVARTTARGAFLGIARAAASGAAAGAFVDGGFAGVQAVLALRRGEIEPRAAVREVGLYAARGAFTGAVGVAAAGIVSAGMAATGLAILSAPVAIPIATMLTAGALASRVFDRRFGTR